MKIELIRIGNSRGIRIPKPLIDHCGLGDTVDLKLDGDRLVISPGRSPCEGWDEIFRAAGSSEKDELLLEPSAPSEFDRSEWEW
jgi:antitoxin MazE